MMQLQINGDPGQVVWLRRPNYLIGRSSACNLRFRDANLELVHAHLKVRDGVVTLVGQDDAPVEVNGVRVENETRLNHGDRVALGKVSLAVMDPEQEKSGAQPETKNTRRDTEADQKTTERAAPEVNWVLHGLSSGLAGRRYTVTGSVVVGRGQACDIRLAEAHLSRCHARLSTNGDSLLIEDLQSSNGTFVNGRRIRHARLKNGDELSLDTVKFRVIHALTEEDSDATMLHGVEGKQNPPRPAGPTAIDIQRANLRRMRENTAGHMAVTPRAQRPGPRAPAGGWLAVTVIVVLAGALWGAKSFLGVPFLG